MMNNAPDPPHLQEAAVDLQLRGRRALVTAASSGIGKACAAALAEEGAEVFVCARTPERLADAAQETGARGFLAADVTSSADTDRLLAAAVDTLGGLDILVTNVPNPSVGGFDQMTDEDWDRTHQATLMSVVRLTRLALPWLVQSSAPRIVNLSSTAAHEVLPGRLFSATYRSALAAMVKHLSVEVAADRVTVNVIAPGNVLTPDWDQASARDAASRVPLGRLGSAREVGALCAYLCSAQAAYITGQTIVIDGGVSRVIW
jgi:3-oxoacyl-[acyl-carrier protein] reductase